MLAFAVFACGGDDGAGPTPSTQNDSGNDSAEASVADDSNAPNVDASQAHCTLFDGTDPVGLCVQKVVIRSMHAVLTDAGVAASWDPKTGIADIDDAGAIAHRLHDDAAYGAVLALYEVNAVRYGDNEIDAIVNADLPRIAGILESEMATLPKEYGGELYRDLRYVAVGLRYILADDEATKIDAIANAYGRAIYDVYYRALPLPDDGVLGVASAGDDASAGVAYDAVDATTGAFALVDMAMSHAPDAATSAKWQSAGLAVIDHVWRRARDARTGLIPRTLLTSDAPDAGDTATSDTLTTDAQATIALALLRMRALVPADAAAAPALSAYPLGAHAVTAIAALNQSDASLWDEASTGYFTALGATDSGIEPSKPTRANALVAAAIERSISATPDSYRAQLPLLRKLLVGTSPTVSGLFAALLDQSGYFPSLTRDFKLPDESAGARARHYETAATTAACEGLSDFGDPVQGATP